MQKWIFNKLFNIDIHFRLIGHLRRFKKITIKYNFKKLVILKILILKQMNL